MNLQPLFQAQKQISERIVKEKGLEGQDLLAKDIRALLTELGELSNRERSFKYWSKDQEPVTELAYAICRKCGGSGTPIGIPVETGIDCWNCEGTGELVSNPLLEEYADCLSFILKIGNDLGITHEDICIEDDLTGEDVTETFNLLFISVTTLSMYLDVNIPASITKEDLKEAYHDIIERFVGLGESQLGFTWDEIVTAYYKKNEENHRRQESGY